MNKSNERYQQSTDYVERAKRLIPLASQTFSKSYTHYPLGGAPFAITKAAGARVWDIDGNEYVDFTSSLCAVTLGYSDPEVDAAVRNQLSNGVIFPLSHPIELAVAELISELVPCAEMVRYGKNGSDATAGAVRLARAFTGREHVAVCGYHGWQDWYIGSTARRLGVPTATRALTHTFQYNDLTSLDRLLTEHAGQIAAIVMEPMNVDYPADGFLAGVRELATKAGALLIFDETITGFRFANGGAQELFGVTPDLATFGKGIANGYPLSVVAGRRDVMRLMEEVFFSFTFGGEALSLAAAQAVLLRLRREPVLSTLEALGLSLMERFAAMAARRGWSEKLRLKGHPTWTFLSYDHEDEDHLYEIKTFLTQTLCDRGILSNGTHNINLAQNDGDFQKVVDAYEFAFDTIFGKPRLDLRAATRVDTLRPLFKVR